MLRTALVLAATALATTGAIVNVEFAHPHLPFVSSVRNGSLPLRLFVYVLVKSAVAFATRAERHGEHDMQIVYAHAAQMVTEVYVVFVLMLWRS
jgi:hypothetical protein